MDHDIRIGSTVQLLYWRDKEVHDFVVTDIFFERYLTDYKTIVEAKYYSEKSECWFIETYYINDFFKAMKKAEEYTDNKEDFRTILDDYLKDKPNVKIVKIIEDI